MSLENIVFMNQRRSLRKNRLLVLFILVVVWGCLHAEEISVEVLCLSDGAQVSWTVSNAVGHIIYSSDDFLKADTAYMQLDEEQRFHLNLIVNEISPNDSNLLLLQINGAAIMLIKADIGLGEFSYPFVTGYKAPVLKIVGGTNAAIKDFPWQVYFSSGDYMCGGTIISKRWILTAAHCTQDEFDLPISSSVMSVKVGSAYNTGPTGKWYDVKSYTIHKDYGTNGLLYDIAALELYEDIDFSNAEVIELVSMKDVADGATDPGVMSTVTGWGIIGVDPDKYSSILQKVQLPIVSNQTAAEVWGNTSNTILMAGYKNGNKDACSGDSGGPLIVPVDGGYKIAGVVSWGSEDCDTYGAFTRVSSYLDWIEATTGVASGAVMGKPKGNTEVCYGTLASSYTTSEATQGSYEWELVPDTVGTLSFQEETATIVWNNDFHGTAELKVRASIDGNQTDWALQQLEVRKNTRLFSDAADVVICEGEDATFFVETEGHNLSYLWYKDSLFYRNTKVASLTFSFSDTLSSGAYYCVVSGSCGDTTTNIYNLTVYPNTVITSMPERQTVAQNKEAALSVGARGHNKQFQWYKDNIPLAGANDSFVTFKEADANDIGLYHVEVSGTCGRDTSLTAYLYVDFQVGNAAQARLWPSVVEDGFVVALSTPSVYSLEVYNQVGQLLAVYEDLHEQSRIDVSAWSSGHYVIKLISRDLTESFRIIKK